MIQSCSQARGSAVTNISKSSAYKYWLALSPLLSPLHSLYSYSEPRASDGRTAGLWTVFCLLFTICVRVLFSYHHYYSNYFYYFQYPPSRQWGWLSATAEIWLSLQWLQFTGIFQRFHDRSSYQQPIIAPHIQSTDRSAGRPWLRRQGVTQLYYQPPV